MSKYLGPAGIFSTDDACSDATQIAEEQGPWDEEEFFWEDDHPVADVVYGGCSKCTWWSSAIYWAGDQEDLDRAKEELYKKHDLECPDCDGGQISFG